MSKDICQFYVVVGDSTFVAPNDNNVYINATNIVDYEIIQNEIFKVYKEKAKLGVVVASDIIFLVGGISDSEKADDIINKLRLNGKIQVIKKESKELVEDPKKTIYEEEKEKSIVVNDGVEDNNKIETEQIVKKDDKVKEEIIKQPDNVYKRDFESTNYNSYIGKPIEKKDKFGKLPLIIFIISLLLFIGSVVLLFVL